MFSKLFKALEGTKKIANGLFFSFSSFYPKRIVSMSARTGF